LVVSVDCEHLQQALEVPELGEVVCSHVLIVLDKGNQLCVFCSHLSAIDVMIAYIRICCPLISADAMEIILWKSISTSPLIGRGLDLLDGLDLGVVDLLLVLLDVVVARFYLVLRIYYLLALAKVRYVLTHSS
jgi:hypothetical protein